MGKLITREEQQLENTWDLTTIFESDEDFETAYKALEDKVADNEKFKDGFDSAAKLADALELERSLDTELGKLFVYAHLKHDQDTSNDTYSALESRARSLAVKYSTAWSFLVPAIMEIPEETLKEFAEDERLAEFKFDLEKLNKQRPYVLSDAEEQLLAQAGEVMHTPTQVYGMFNNADIEFKPAVDSDGKEHPLTQGNFVELLKSSDRTLRESAYTNLYSEYSKFKNTLSQTLAGVVNTHVFSANVRGYESSRHQALSNNHIPESVYDNLVNTVNDNLHILHRYTELRKKFLGVDELKMYDMYVPLVEDTDFDMTYENAKEWLVNALQPLGSEYVDIVKEGLENRWVDVYENKGKRTGAYSSGTYGTNPYILMNWQDNVNNLFTLAHEFGHSVHSYYSRKNQPANTSGYSIFVAEVASTFNEALLADYMFKNLDDKKQKLYLLNEQLEGFRGTVFRQTMFAEFEHAIHKMKEEGEPLTAGKLNEVYGALNMKYFGEAVDYDEAIDVEWARIPHFYMNYYVYQYATGYSAAASLSKQVLEEGESTAQRYINEFLKKGSSNYPIEILKNAGVDMTTSEPVENALTVFETQLSEFEQLLDELEK
ncbi:Oligoendopeptidase F, plasmid [Jeotgalicoccus aerolatus]|uniref:Oligopeptidase F n=1 Tax=Jeotgalicoccus aerolatus TaxID=709510 RepID=A0ABS4HLJ2_9STAP|nr:oligoendopeptidase F [Jeotgalicoccus aerolatus]MBP1951272.1 oligoendopeptidase F [Jeotgalicoccus aerolatus]GGD98773.1 oligoendopeptidase F [Jeotgalicoccus aerolatus]CAD2077367.1 Oligoendopeptidase F, plasmid [Jeotgalicoccus aerolatus]